MSQGGTEIPRALQRTTSEPQGLQTRSTFMSDLLDTTQSSCQNKISLSSSSLISPRCSIGLWSRNILTRTDVRFRNPNVESSWQACSVGSDFWWASIKKHMLLRACSANAFCIFPGSIRKIHTLFRLGWGLIGLISLSWHHRYASTQYCQIISLPLRESCPECGGDELLFNTEFLIFLMTWEGSGKIK